MAFVEVSTTQHTIVSDTYAPSTATRTLELWALTKTVRLLKS